MSLFQLQFPLNEVERWAAEYTYPAGDTAVIEIGDAAKQQGYLNRPQFLAMAKWKSARPSRHHQRNDAATVEEVTRFAFGASSETVRLKALTLLRGVQPRTASALLHLCHRDPYPLMDVRAFGSLGVEFEPRDWVEVWPEYVEKCRSLAAEAKTSMRMLDRAWWGYSAKMGVVAKPIPSKRVGRWGSRPSGGT